MILIAGILVLGIIAVGLMVIYAGVCWSYYKELSKEYEAAMEREVTTDLERSAYTPDNPNPPVSTARRLPGACKECGSPSPSGLCGDCREDSEENTV